jgi:hypothetical protein
MYQLHNDAAKISGQTDKSPVPAKILMDGPPIRDVIILGTHDLEYDLLAVNSIRVYSREE